MLSFGKSLNTKLHFKLFKPILKEVFRNKQTKEAKPGLMLEIMDPTQTCKHNFIPCLCCISQFSL